MWHRLLAPIKLWYSLRQLTALAYSPYHGSDVIRIISVLVELGSPKAIPSLVQCTHNPNRDVRLAASKALVKLQPASILPLLHDWIGVATSEATAALVDIGEAVVDSCIEELKLLDRDSGFNASQMSFCTLFDDINGMIVDGIERGKCTIDDGRAC